MANFDIDQYLSEKILENQAQDEALRKSSKLEQKQESLFQASKRKIMELGDDASNLVQGVKDIRIQRDTPKPGIFSFVEEANDTLFSQKLQDRIKGAGQSLYDFSKGKSTLVDTVNKIINPTEDKAANPESDVNTSINTAARVADSVSRMTGSVLAAPVGLLAQAQKDNQALTPQDWEDYRTLTNPGELGVVPPEVLARLNSPMPQRRTISGRVDPRNSTDWDTGFSEAEMKKPYSKLDYIQKFVERQNTVNSIADTFDTSGIVDRTIEKRLATNSKKDVDAIQAQYAGAKQARDQGEYFKAALGFAKGAYGDVVGTATDLINTPEAIPAAIASNAAQFAVGFMPGGIGIQAMDNFGESSKNVAKGIENNKKATGEALPSFDQMTDQYVAANTAAALETIGDKVSTGISRGAVKSIQLAKASLIKKVAAEGGDVAAIRAMGPTQILKMTADATGKTAVATASEGATEYFQSPLENAAQLKDFDPYEQRVSAVMGAAGGGGMAAPASIASVIGDRITEVQGAKTAQEKPAKEFYKAVQENDPSPYLNPEAETYDPAKAAGVLFGHAQQETATPETKQANLEQLNILTDQIQGEVSSLLDQYDLSVPERRAAFEQELVEAQDSLAQVAEAAPEEVPALESRIAELTEKLAQPVPTPEEAQAILTQATELRKKSEIVYALQSRLTEQLAISAKTEDSAVDPDVTKNLDPLSKAQAAPSTSSVSSDIPSMSQSTQMTQSTLDPNGEYTDSTSKEGIVGRLQLLKQPPTAKDKHLRDLQIEFEDRYESKGMSIEEALNDPGFTQYVNQERERYAAYGKGTDMFDAAVAELPQRLASRVDLVTTTAASAQVKESLVSGATLTATSLIDNVLNKSDDPALVSMASKIRKFVEGIPLKIDTLTENTLASYSSTKGEITFNQTHLDSPKLAYTAIHEMTHAATIKAVQSDDAFAAAVFDLMDHVVKVNPNLAQEYGLTDTLEFLAESFANPGLQEQLKKLPASKATSQYLSDSKIQNAWDALVSYIMKALGLSKEDRNVFEQAMKLNELGFEKTQAAGDRKITNEEITSMYQRNIVPKAQYQSAAERLLKKVQETYADIQATGTAEERAEIDTYAGPAVQAQLTQLIKELSSADDNQRYPVSLVNRLESIAADLRFDYKATTALQEKDTYLSTDLPSLVDKKEASKLAGTLEALSTEKSPKDADYRSRNLIADYFSQDSGSQRGDAARPLVLVKDFLSALSNGSVKAIDYLKAQTLTDTQQYSLDVFFEKAKAWNTKVQQAITQRPNAEFYYKDPLQFLYKPVLDAKGKPTGKFDVDENFKTAISLAAFQTVLDLKSKGNFKTDDEINELLGWEEGSPISKTEREIFGSLGTSGDLLMNAAGQLAYEALGLKANKDAKADLEPKIKAALGAHVQKLLIELGLIERKEIAAKTFGEYLAGDSKYKASLLKANDRAKIYFFNLVPENKEVQQIVDSVKQSQSVLSKLFSVDPMVKMPSLEPIPFGQKLVKNGTTEVPTALSKVLKKKHQEKNRLREDHWRLLEAFSPEGFVTMAGFTPVTPDTIHVSRRDSIQATNDALLREYDNYVDLAMTMLGTGNKRLDQAFFLEFSAWGNHRVGIATTGFNPQASKIHRHSSYQPDWETKVDMADLAQVDNFYLRVGEALGYKTDAKASVDLLPTIKADLTASIYQDAIELLRERIYEDTITAFTAAQENIILDAVKKGGEAMQSYNALVALAHMSQATKEQKTSFTVQMPAEVDGKVNGSMLATMVFGAAYSVEALYEVLNRGGFYEQGSGETQFNYWKSKGNRDLYEATIAHTYDDLQQRVRKQPRLQKTIAAIEEITGSLVNLSTGKVESAGRKLIKGPTTEIVFGSSLKKTTTNMADKFIENIYTRIEALAQQDPDPATLLSLVRALNVLLRNPTFNEKTTTVADLLEHRFTPQEIKAIHAGFDNTIGESVRVAIKNDFGVFLKKRNTHTAAANLTFGLYDAAYQAIRKDFIDEQVKLGNIAVSKAKGVPIHDITVAQEKAIQDRIQAVFPKMHSLLSKVSKQDNAALFIGDTVNTLSNNSNYSAEVLFANTVKDTGSDRINAAGFEQEYAAPGVKMAPFSIHSLDSYISHMVQLTMNLLNTHDAVSAGIGNIREAAERMNAATWDAVFQYSPAAEMLSALENSIQGMKALLDKENSPTLRKAIAESINALTAEYNSRNPDRPTTPANFLEVSLAQLKQMAFDADKIKFSALKQLAYIDQYTFEGGAYTVTDAQRKEAEKALAALGSKRYAPIVADIAAIIKTIQSELGIKQEAVQETKSQEQIEAAYETDLTHDNAAQIAILKDLIEAPDTDPALIPTLKETLAALRKDPGKITVTQAIKEATVLKAKKPKKTKAPKTPKASKTETTAETTKTEEEAEPVDTTNTTETVETTETNQQAQATIISQMLNQGRANSSLDPFYMSTAEIFEDLDQVSPAPAQFQDQLRGLLNGIVNKLYGPAGVFHSGLMRRQALSGRDVYLKALSTGQAPYASKVNTSYFKASEQELFVIEQVEATVRKAIDRNENTEAFAYKELSALFLEARKKLTAADFHEGAWNTATPQEKRIAKKLYGFLFDLDPINGDRSEHLSRFAAMGLAHSKVSQILGFNTEAKPTKTRPTIFARLQEIFTKVLNWFYDRSGTIVDGEPANQRLASLVEQLVDLEAKKKASALRRKNGTIDAIEKAAKKGIETASKKVEEFGKSPSIQNNSNKFIRGIGGVISAVAANRVNKIIEEGMIFNDRVNGNKSNIFTQTVTYMTGPMKEFEELFRLGKKIEADRKKYITQTTQNILAGFANNGADLTPQMKEAISAVYLRGDIQSLTKDYSLTEIAAFLSTGSERADKIQELENLLAVYSDIGDDYLIQARSLGYKLATGETTSEGVMLNAGNIAKGYGSIYQSKITQQQASAAEKILDPLITLYAIEYAPLTQRNLAADVLRTEMARPNGENGIAVTLQMHRYLQKEAKEKLFDQKDALFAKGYLPDVLNPRTEMVIAPEADREDWLNKGYAEGDLLYKDPNDLDKEIYRIFVLKDAGLSAHPSGMLSQTGQRAKGTKKVGSNRDESTWSGSNNVQQLKQITQAKRKQMRARAGTGKSFDPTQVKERYMTPLLNDKGEIVNYRYMMNEARKDAIFERKNQFEHLLGVMAGSTFDKVSSTAHNKTVIKALFDLHAVDYAVRPFSYVEVGPNSKDPEMKEVYALLPDETKKEIERVWGTESMMVRSDMMHLAFGYRKYSLSNIFEKSPAELSAIETLFKDTVQFLLASYARLNIGMDPVRAARYAQRAGVVIRRIEEGWKTVSDEVKNMIVVKTGIVLLGNVWSNTTLLMMHGISLPEIAKHHTTAYKAAQRYQEDSEALFKLQNQDENNLTAAQKTKRNQEMIQLKDAIARNPVTELMDAGLMPTIVQDVNFDEEAYAYKNYVQRKAEKGMSKLNPKVLNIAKQLYMSKDTPHYKMLSKATQLSDFVARYTMYQHMIAKPQDALGKKEAIAMAAESFVNYDIPLPPAIQYLDDMGLLPFTKYFLSIQRVILNLAREHPVRSLMVAAGNNFFDMMPTVMDSSILSRLGNNPFYSGPFRALDAFGKILPVQAAMSLFR